MTYNTKQIAKELRATADGEAYFGNALRVTKDVPGVTSDERSVLDRWLTGANTSSDRFRLQEIAIKLHMMDTTDPVTEYYTDRANSGQAALAK